MVELEYRALGRTLRHLVANEVKREYFQHLKCPNTKSGALPFQDTKYRVTMMPRPRCQLGNGIHNLHVGDDEISLCIAGSFNDPNDCKQGFTPKMTGSPFRMILGRYLAFPRFKEALEFSLKDEAPTLSLFLTYGLYEEFVGEILPVINNNIDIFKSVVKDSTYRALSNEPQYQTL